MNEIKGFEGNTMTGWTVRMPDGTIKTAVFSRFTHDQVLTLYYDKLLQNYVVAEQKMTTHRDTLEEALEVADTIAKMHGGWCASPCGIDDFALKTLEAEGIKAAGYHRQPEHYAVEFSHVILPINVFPVGCDIVINKTSSSCGYAIAQVVIERERQDGKWGGAEHDDALPVDEWHSLLSDYIGWARRMGKMGSFDKARRRFIQVAALAVACVESFDGRVGVVEDDNG